MEFFVFLVLERLYEIDDKAIPRKPGSARFRVLPNIVPVEISGVDKDQELGEISVVERNVQKKPVGKPKEVVKNEKERKMQGRKEEPQRKTVLEEHIRNEAGNSLKGGAPATRETRLSKKSQQGGNLSLQTSDNKLARETNEKKEIGVGSYAKDNKERISPVKRVLPQEPEPDKSRITLAVKLPTGERLQQSFRPSDLLKVILKFAGSSSRRDFIGCELVCLEPKLILQNMNKTIRQSGLRDKTLLYIQLPEPK